MKNLSLALVLSLWTSTALAAVVEDVSILEMTYKEDAFELRLKPGNEIRDTYFIVEIGKSDEKALEKIAVIMKKLKAGKGHKLNLQIPSFSAYPPGAFYRSQSVRFMENVEGETLVGR